MVLLQETKLGEGDVSPRMEGYSIARRERKGSGGVLHRGGGLAAYIRRELSYSVDEVRSGSVMEAQVIRIPMSKGTSATLVIIYIPPYREAGGGRQTDRIMADMRRLRRGRDVMWYGDFNAHHSLWMRTAEARQWLLTGELQGTQEDLDQGAAPRTSPLSAEENWTPCTGHPSMNYSQTISQLRSRGGGK